MPAGIGTDPALGTTSVVGRYFGLVSTIPSVLLAAWVYLILACGAATGEPSIAQLAEHSPLAHPGYLAAAVALALLFAFVGHPLQFTLVQLMEGYWGKSRLARNLGEDLTLRQLARLGRARSLADRGEDLEESLPTVANLSQHLNARALFEQPQTAREAVRSQLMRNAAGIAVSRYPSEPIHVMPTALGNTLRRHELLAGAAVGLPVLSWATHIGLVADPTHSRYLNDQRTQMDLAARMCASSAIAALVTFTLLWNNDWWALITLAPYAVTWLSYQGAVVSADSYGAALRAWVDLNRFKLYDALGLEPAKSIEAENARNQKLQGFLRGGPVDLAVRPLSTTHGSAQ